MTKSWEEQIHERLPPARCERQIHAYIERSGLDRILGATKDEHELVTIPGDPVLGLNELGELGALAEAVEQITEGLYADTAPLPLNPLETAEWELFWAFRVGEGDLSELARNPATATRGLSGTRAEGDLEVVRRWQEAGVEKILIVGNGVSVEPRALAEAGFLVTALDASRLATYVARMYPCATSLRGYVSGHRWPWLEDEIVDTVRRPGGSVTYCAGSILHPRHSRGPYDLVIARRTLQCFFPWQIHLLDAVLERLRPGGLLHLHEHNMRWYHDDYLVHLRKRGMVLYDDGNPNWDALVQMDSG